MSWPMNEIRDWNAQVIAEFRARAASGEERGPISAKQKQDYPGFADYESNTTREIPVVVLDPA